MRLIHIIYITCKGVRVEGKIRPTLIFLKIAMCVDKWYFGKYTLGRYVEMMTGRKLDDDRQGCEMVVIRRGDESKRRNPRAKMQVSRSVSAEEMILAAYPIT